MTPDVSILITSYNIEAYIERAIASALAQQGVNVEVIVVDDVSQDGTWSRIEKIIDPRLIRHQMEKNGGPSAARNAGIALATGRYIAILDGDDSIEPDRLARCLKLAETRQADIVVDNLNVCREIDGAEFPMFDAARLRQIPLLTLAEFIRGNQSFLGGYSLGYFKPVFNASFLRQHALSYDPEIRIGEDYLLLAQALGCGAVCAVDPNCGYRYTVRQGSISHRLKLDDVRRFTLCDQKLASRFPLNREAQAAQAKRTRCLREAFAFTQLVEAIKAKDIAAILKAIASCPSCLIQLWRPIHARLGRMVRQHG